MISQITIIGHTINLKIQKINMVDVKALMKVFSLHLVNERRVSVGATKILNK